MPQRLTARPIQARTKGEIKRLRKSGWVPVSVQHRGEETLHLEEEARPLDEFIHRHGEAAMLELEIEPDRRRQTVLVHDVQRDPISQHLLHVTFQRVSRNEPVKVHVPVVFVGTPEAAREHTAIVQHPTEVLEIRSLPQNLPEHLTVDLSNLGVAGAFRVSDLPHDDKYEILTAADTVLATLVTLKAQVEPEEEVAPAAEAAEAPTPEAEETEA